MNTSDALKLLGLTSAVSEAGVRGAFAVAARRAHPDTGEGLSKASIAELQQARDALIKVLNEQKNTCDLCGGVGSFRGVKCPKCSGRGTK